MINSDSFKALNREELISRLTTVMNRQARKNDLLLATAYHTSKGLSELLGSIQTTDMQQHEKDAVAEAHRHSVHMFTELNKIVEDFGNLPSEMVRKIRDGV